MLSLVLDVEPDVHDIAVSHHEDRPARQDTTALGTVVAEPSNVPELARTGCRTVRSRERRDPCELSVAFGDARTVTDGLPDAATLLKQCHRRRLIAVGARHRRK